MIKLSDYIFQYLAKIGVKDVFMISGGGAMHLVDSVGNTKGIKYLCPHHEQAAAIAAEGYSRVSGKMGVVVVTSGPGGTNTLTGVIGQWLDSLPCLYISGQIKQETCIESCKNIGLRQLGDQEINIVDIVKPVTKYSVIIKDPATIRYHLEKAIHLATSGRPGPVWIDIPLDVQAAIIDGSSLKGYSPAEDANIPDKSALDKGINELLALLKSSKRPLIIAGHGIRLSKSIDLFTKLIKELGMPVVTTFNGYDLVPSDHPMFVGRIGTLGTRAGNYALQNSDLVISIGSRNNIRQISYNWEHFARGAKLVSVDIDPTELNKPTIKPHLRIVSDAGAFLNGLADMNISGRKEWNEWVAWCMERKKKYPVVLPQYWKKNKPINPYCFVETLTKIMKPGSIMATGDGTACVVPFQAGIVKKGQRIFWNSGCASMGYDLPASIGACIASNKKSVICLAGDGSLQMNIQELQTVAFNKLPIKLFVLNNGGYVSIKQTQDAFFNGRHVGCGPDSGVSFPDIVKVAKAYGLPSKRISDQRTMTKAIKAILKKKGPFVCEVMLDPDQKFAPRVSSEKKPDGRMVSKPLEDMFPFLERKEFKNNMLIDIIAE